MIGQQNRNPRVELVTKSRTPQRRIRPRPKLLEYSTYQLVTKLSESDKPAVISNAPAVSGPASYKNTSITPTNQGSRASSPSQFNIKLAEKNDVSMAPYRTRFVLSHASIRPRQIAKRRASLSRAQVLVAQSAPALAFNRQRSQRMDGTSFDRGPCAIAPATQPESSCYLPREMLQRKAAERKGLQ